MLLIFCNLYIYDFLFLFLSILVLLWLGITQMMEFLFDSKFFFFRCLCYYNVTFLYFLFLGFNC
jgi:hypothetical protein